MRFVTFNPLQNHFSPDSFFSQNNFLSQTFEYFSFKKKFLQNTLSSAFTYIMFSINTIFYTPLEPIQLHILHVYRRKSFLSKAKIKGNLQVSVFKNNHGFCGKVLWSDERNFTICRSVDRIAYPNTLCSSLFKYAQSVQTDATGTERSS